MVGRRERGERRDEEGGGSGAGRERRGEEGGVCGAVRWGDMCMRMKG